MHARVISFVCVFVQWRAFRGNHNPSLLLNIARCKGDHPRVYPVLLKQLVQHLGPPVHVLRGVGPGKHNNLRRVTSSELREQLSAHMD